MQSIRRGNRFGFTLIELLIVTVLLAVISLAIYATFNNGVKIWQKINEAVPQEDLNIFFEELTVDLRNVFKYSLFNFLGESSHFEFITIVNSQKMRKNTVGKISYSYDPQSKVITKTSWDFSQIYEGSFGMAKQLIGNVKSLKFRYYFYDEGTKEYLWLDQWSKEGLPLAVRVELVLDKGVQSDDFVRTISIPLSN